MLQEAFGVLYDRPSAEGSDFIVSNSPPALSTSYLSTSDGSGRGHKSSVSPTAASSTAVSHQSLPPGSTEASGGQALKSQAGDVNV